MPAVVAEVQDLRDRYEETLTADQERVAETRLADALAELRAKVTSLDARVDDGTLDQSVVSRVQVDMVLRLIRNPEGKRQESIDDYSWTRDQALSDGQLYVTANELALLAPPRRSRLWRSVRLGVPVELR